MKVSLARKEHRCGFEHCCFGKVIKRGSIAVTELFRKEGRWYTLYFHPECFMQWKGNYISSKVKDLEAKIEKRTKKATGKRGRPRKYSDPMKVRNFISQLFYHKKLGHMDKVEELEGKIRELALDK